MKTMLLAAVAACAVASQAAKADSYVSDPAKPVPYRARPIEETYRPGSRWYYWLTEDQRFVDGRPDVLTWKTDTLTEDITFFKPRPFRRPHISLCATETNCA